MDKRLVNAIGIVVTTVWALSFLADVVMKDYDPSPYVHFAMMVIVGSAFGTKFLQGRGENGND